MGNFRYEATTELVVKTFQFDWTVENFSLCKLKNGEELRSPYFHAEMEDEMMIWYISLYPFGDEETSIKDVSIFICLDSCLRSETIVGRPKFIFINSQHNLIFEHQFEAFEFSEGGSGWGPPKFCLRHDLLHKLPDDILKIVCNFEVSTNAQKSTAIFTPRNSLNSLWNDKEFSDVTISVSSTDFRAHKCVLAAKSPVFRSMFEHNLSEAKSNKVEIEDIKPEIFAQLLKYLYNGNFNSWNANELLVAADKYCIEDLKELCEQSISRNMTLENCLENLTLSDLHSAKNLKKNTLKFVLTHASELTSPERLQELKMMNSILPEIVKASACLPRKETTEIPITKLTFQWKIVNITFALKDKFLTSPDLYEHEREKWAIKIKMEKESSETSVFLELITSDRKEVKTKFTFSLRNTEGNEIAAFVNDTFQTFNTDELKMNGKKNLFSTKGILDQLIGDTLEIFCTLEVMKESYLKLNFL